MTNLKRVPFDYERWKAAGSRLDRVEDGDGNYIMAIHYFDGVDVNKPIAYIDCAGNTYTTKNDGKYIDNKALHPNDLFLLIEQRTRIELDGLVADREFNNGWSISNRVINICTYYNDSKFLRYHCDVSIPTINTILSLIKLIQDEEADTEAGC